MNDDQWAKIAEWLMLLAVALLVSCVVDLIFSILSHLNKHL